MLSSSLKKYIKRYLDTDRNKKTYYIMYSLLFCLVALFCFSGFIVHDKSFVWKSDGWVQHYKALTYYGTYLRNIFRNLISEHKLIIPDWDFYIGEGSDILTALHYYVIGDPITLFSALVPTKYMHYFYSFSVVLRIYLSGIAFSELCFGTNQKNRYSVLAGSIAYCFCTWALINVARHPFFLNPMIYFPLMILGIEKVIRKEKPFLFIIISMVSAVSNFYYFYMIVILAVVYAIIRLGFIYKKKVGQAIIEFLRLGIYAVIGVCVAGIILLPVLMIFLGDSRVGMDQQFFIFYPMYYYTSLPGLFLVNTPHSVLLNNYSHWLCMGFAAPVVISVFSLFSKKKDSAFIKTLFIICIFIIISPMGGRLMNGMAYAVNRWSWAFALLCVYILVVEWESLLTMSRKHWNKLMLISVLYNTVCLLLENSRGAATVSAILIILITLFVLRDKHQNSNNETVIIKKQIILIMIIISNSINNAFWTYSSYGANYLANMKDNKSIIKELLDNESTVIKQLNDDEYTRFTGTSLTKNANIINKVSSTQYYWSVSNSYINQFRDDLHLREAIYFSYLGYDDRSTLVALASVDYYSMKDDNEALLPNGFYGSNRVETSGKTTDEYYVYKSEYSLPLVYSYDKYVPQDLWNSYNPVQKQEAMLSAGYVGKAIDGLCADNKLATNYLIPFEVKCDNDNVQLHGNNFIVTDSNGEAIIKLSEDTENCEVYIGFEGVSFKPTSKYDLYFGDESVDPQDLYNKNTWNALSDEEKKDIRKERFYWTEIKDASITMETPKGVNKWFTYKHPNSSFSSGRKNFIINVGYQDDSISEIKLKFSLPGIYSFEELNAYKISMDGFGDRVNSLKESGISNLEIDVDTISAKIDVQNKKLLCVAVPYSKGWSAYVDGEKREVFCVNEHYMGIVVKPGECEMVMNYRTPFKKAGLIITVIGLVLYITVVMLYRKK